MIGCRIAVLLCLSITSTLRADSIEPSTSPPEPDRAAILAMAGEYVVEFNFEETVSTDASYRLAEPYIADATELIEVIEDRGDFISLQHILVVGYGESMQVIKHWRQDWTYEDASILEFKGCGEWSRRRLTADEAAGTWSQAVFQVDDAPRYESYGRWTHVGGRSSWESRETWRPLPRRERKTRSDYDVVVCRNRHTITPEGWVHEQDNRKVVLDEAGAPVRVLAHETGLNWYTADAGPAFEKARAFWASTAPFWKGVRAAWAPHLERDVVRVRPVVDGAPLWEALAPVADDPEATPMDIERVLERFIASDAGVDGAPEEIPAPALDSPERDTVAKAPRGAGDARGASEIERSHE